jgi:hypothetical protein
MMRGANLLEYRRLRAPREDRTALVDPPWSEIPATLAANRRLHGSYQYDFHGISLQALAAEARRELVAEAARYTATYADPPSDAGKPPTEADLVFLAGHQPQLFHPGVWFKNFALDHLARQHRAVAVNLIIDSDTIKSQALRVPGGSAGKPQVSLIPVDEPGPVVPFEERRVLDRRLFAAAGGRAAGHLAPLVPDPLVRDYWPLAVGRMGHTENLGDCLAQSRHQLERRLGLATLEIPQSHVCQLPSFAVFTAHLLAELPRLVTVYNEVVQQYRQIHRIRSTAHPVPDLAVDGPWLEAPYWIWTAQDARRRRLFVCRRGRELVLSDRQGLEVGLPFSPEGGLDRAVEGLMELPGRGVKLRSRALVTTLFARLVVGDLFLHGIGGAKYDQVTDALVERFFGLQPPGFLVLSATLLLPVARKRVRAEEARTIDRRLRDLDYHPESALDGIGCGHTNCEAAELVAAKKRWIATPQTPQNARTRWREFRRINAALQPFVADRREELLRQRTATAAALAAEAILSWREYAFCLYPERYLREAFTALLPNG